MFFRAERQIFLGLIVLTSGLVAQAVPIASPTCDGLFRGETTLEGMTFSPGTSSLADTKKGLELLRMVGGKKLRGSEAFNFSFDKTKGRFLFNGDEQSYEARLNEAVNNLSALDQAVIQSFIMAGDGIFNKVERLKGTPDHLFPILNQAGPILSEALAKLPQYDGVVYRENVVPAAVAIEFRAGRTVKLQRFFSATAKSFSNQFLPNIIFVIKSKSGREISPLLRDSDGRLLTRNNRRFNPVDGEVVFSPEASFKILLSVFDAGLDTTIVVMDEI